MTELIKEETTIRTFILLIFISFLFFLYFKVRQWRATLPVEKRWHRMKASIALGSFTLFFGLNLIVFQDHIVDLIVGSVFFVVGGANIFLGYRGYKHLLPYVLKEAEESR